jgi:hypothetical protein
VRLEPGIRRLDRPKAGQQSMLRHHLAQAPERRGRASPATRNSDRISLVASSIGTIRSSAGCPSSHACRDPSWCCSIPRIGGRRGRFLRCAERFGAGRTSPAAGKASPSRAPLRSGHLRTRHFTSYKRTSDHELPTQVSRVVA